MCIRDSTHTNGRWILSILLSFLLRKYAIHNDDIILSASPASLPIYILHDVDNGKDNDNDDVNDDINDNCFFKNNFNVDDDIDVISNNNNNNNNDDINNDIMNNNNTLIIINIINCNGNQIRSSKIITSSSITIKW